MGEARQWIAFGGAELIAEGGPAMVAAAVKRHVDSAPDGPAPVLVFDAVTSEPVEIDLRGSLEEVVARVAPVPADAPRKGPGRPKLGVVAREVTLLPRHWEWLAAQPGGASVTLRRLVEEARRAGGAEERRRVARERAYRFMSCIAGDEPGFEEALRALYAGDEPRFSAETDGWPADVREHARTLAARAFADEADS